jgi:hypothetical protein
MSTISQAIERIISCRKTFFFKNDMLVSSLTSKEIQVLTEGFPFRLPTEIVELYQFCPIGVDIDAGLTFFLPLEEALDICLRSRINYDIPSSILSQLAIPYLKYFKGCFKDEKYQEIFEYYPHNYCELPIIRGYCKEIYHVVCGKQNSISSPVWFKFQDGETVQYTSSLTNLMLTVAECYETGAYYNVFHEEYGEWEIESDLERVELIFEKYNPDQIDTWRKIWRN